MAQTNSWLRLGVAFSAGVLALADAPHGARAALLKPDGSPPLVMPNTLLVEGGEPATGERRPAAATGEHPAAATLASSRPVPAMKQSPRTCSAAAVRIPQVGTRIVTARHCADHRDLEVLDEQYHVTPIRQVDAAGVVDLAVLEVEGKMPWPGLEMRPAAAVPLGQRLCAWHIRRGPTGLVRERICARLMRREQRPGADPLLVMSHPYPAGTSGSALVDPEGRVVGIVVASTGMGGLAEPIEGVLKLPPPPTLLAAGAGRPVKR